MTTFSEADPDVVLMLSALDAWYKDNVWPNPPPAGMQVQMHPWAEMRVRQSVNYAYLARAEDWRDRFPVPVKVNPDLARGTWRLVTVTEAVHIGGQMHD